MLHPIPTVPAIARLTGTFWQLVVTCPYCGDRHCHGSGSDVAPILGTRQAHCGRGLYQLTLASRFTLLTDVEVEQMSP